jgi:hypothetical protein
MAVADDPPCGHPGCRRDADYRITAPAVPAAVRCRWHADSSWRPHGSAARVVALHAEVPSIDPTRDRRGGLLAALVIAACLLIVVLGFAVIAPVML